MRTIVHVDIVLNGKDINETLKTIIRIFERDVNTLLEAGEIVTVTDEPLDD